MKNQTVTTKGLAIALTRAISLGILDEQSLRTLRSAVDVLDDAAATLELHATEFGYQSPARLDRQRAARIALVAEALSEALAQ